MLNLFLANQREIQQSYPGCILVFATDEADYVPELKKFLKHYQLRGDVITYETMKPDYAKNRIWNIACGREALRRYALSCGVRYVFFMDSDMTYDTSVISIMRSKIQGYNVAFSGYKLRDDGSWGFGAGCLLINRDILSKITFRCYEFPNGVVIGEDEVLDIDLFSKHAKALKGIFVTLKHFRSNAEYLITEPQPVGQLRYVANSLFVRNILIRSSIILKYNVACKLHLLFSTMARKKSKKTGGGE